MAPIPSGRVSVTAAAVAAARSAIAQLLRESIPASADFCVVHLQVRRALRAAAGAHGTPSGHRDVRALMDTAIALDDRHSTAAHVVRTGQAVMRTAIHPERRAVPRDRVDMVLQRLAPRSALVVPIACGPAVVGALSLCYAHSGRSYTARHLPQARRLASRIADALMPARAADAHVGQRAPVDHTRHGAAPRRRLAARN